MAASETGSGKTAAFALPAVQLCVEQLIEAQRYQAKKTGNCNAIENEFQMSTIDRDKSVSIKPGSKGLQIQSCDKKLWAGCRCRSGVQKLQGVGRNKHMLYFECKVRSEGLLRVGLSTREANLDLGTDVHGYGFGSTGIKAHNNKFENYGDVDGERGFSKGDVIGCLIDYSKHVFGQISFVKNGVLLGKAFDVKHNKPLFPTVSLKNAFCELNFGSHFSDVHSSALFVYRPAIEVVPMAHISHETGYMVLPNPNDVIADALCRTEGPLALVIEPTRELARQAFEVFTDLVDHDRIESFDLKISLLIGGVNSQGIAEKLSSGEVDILVGCPSIIASFIKEGKMKTNRLFLLILDEADHLVDKGTVQHIDEILCRIPKSIQTCFFSATLQTRDVKNLAERICDQPIVVDLVGKGNSVPSTIVHCVLEVDVSTDDNLLDIIENESPRYVSDGVHRNGKLDSETDWNDMSQEERRSELIKLIKPRLLVQLLEKLDFDQVLVFVRTNLDASLLETYLHLISDTRPLLSRQGQFSCRVLAGKRSMVQREASLKAFKQGLVRILIATDVAARGIDIPGLPCVIQYTMPDSREVFIHRVGRVGRMGDTGIAISLVAATGLREKVWYCQSGQMPPCDDTRLFQDGGKFPLCNTCMQCQLLLIEIYLTGNCKWFNEASLYQSFIKILGPTAPLALRVEDESLRSTVLNALRLNQGYVESTKLFYESDLVQLASIEKQLQHNYFSIRHQFVEDK